MAQRICWFSGIPSLANLNSKLRLRRDHHVVRRCTNSSKTPNGGKSYYASSSNCRETETPQILRIAVSAVTQLLRLFSPSKPTSALSGDFVKLRDEFPVASVDDVLEIIKSDYDKAYFVTVSAHRRYLDGVNPFNNGWNESARNGVQYKLCYVNITLHDGNFTSSIYAENCIFEDPTIKFRGRELYARNLKLLVPFFDCASIRLQKIEKNADSETNFVLATWKLRTNLKLPWRPLISIDGSTYYELDEDFKIVRHVESWNVSALEAILQIFTLKFENAGD